MNIRILLLIILLISNSANAEFWTPIYYVRINIITNDNMQHKGTLKIFFNSKEEEEHFVTSVHRFDTITPFILEKEYYGEVVKINTDAFRAVGFFAFPSDCFVEIRKADILRIFYYSHEKYDDLGCCPLFQITKSEIDELKNFEPVKVEHLYHGEFEEYITFYFNKLDFELEQEVFEIQTSIIKGDSSKKTDFKELFKKGVIVVGCRTD